MVAPAVPPGSAFPRRRPRRRHIPATPRLTGLAAPAASGSAAPALQAPGSPAAAGDEHAWAHAADADVGGTAAAAADGDAGAAAVEAAAPDRPALTADVDLDRVAGGDRDRRRGSAAESRGES